MVHIPDFPSEGMETLGLITFDDGALSVNSKTSPATDTNGEMKYSLRNVSLNLINSRVQRLISPPTILPQFVKYDHIPGFEADASKFAHPLVSNSIRLGIKHIAWSHIYSDTIIAVDENHFDRKKKRHSLKKGMIAEIDMDGHGRISKQPVHNGSNRVGAGGTSTRSSTARNSHTFHTRAPAIPLSTIKTSKMIALSHQLPVIRIPGNSVRLYKSDPLTEPAIDSAFTNERTPAILYNFLILLPLLKNNLYDACNPLCNPKKDLSFVEEDPQKTFQRQELKQRKERLSLAMDLKRLLNGH
ncbi:hypothetical protein SeLEV6574_g07634 [Synchytrium endobioticum]|uniref:Uncharacterized protein n=1 Tax=Synchytrium endobioticum TaxID=286115 RepID=A0A507CCJ9_9FUNG|nr:hypothetical protein SeLEV6574_g07634 [Synchytrium endobioticum]